MRTNNVFHNGLSYIGILVYGDLLVYWYIDNWFNWLILIWLIWFNCSKSIVKILKKYVKYVQSQ